MACYKAKDVVTMVFVPFLPLPAEAATSSGMGCPFYVQSQELVSVPSSSLISDVSFIHKCGRGCKMTSAGRKRTAERELVQVGSVEFSHDFAKQVFYFNKFCLSNFC